jgi:hypothetical protein
MVGQLSKGAEAMPASAEGIVIAARGIAELG